MDYQIRRNFFETSSSSASALIMVSDKGRRQRVRLSEPWTCIREGYCTGGDGIPHEYLCRWQDKMALMAQDHPLWHKMFKKATGQDFRLYRLYARNFDEILNESRNKIYEDWQHLYMGDDGFHSMYIDLVRGEYGISSTDERRWKLTDDLKQMFAHVHSVALQK